jgi:hypothetical protein
MIWQSMRVRSRQNAAWLAVAVLLSLFAVLCVQLPAIRDPYHIDDDFRHYFWMARFRDPEAFHDDPVLYNVKRVHMLNILGRDLICQFESVGFSLLYQLASYVVAPLTFNKILPFILMVICVTHLFALGRLLELDSRSAFFLVVLFVTYDLTASANISVMPGLQRSFQFALLIVFLYYLIKDSPVGIVVTVVVQALFYAPMFVVSTTAYTLSLIYRRNRRVGIDLRARRVGPLIIGVTLALMTLLPAVLDPQVATGSLSTRDGNVPVWQNPTYGPAGRIPIFPSSFSGFPIFLISGYGGLARLDDLYYMVPLWLLALLILTLLGLERSRVHPHVNSLLAGSLVAWLLCWSIALATGSFILRYPFKYTNAPLPLWILLYCGLNIKPFLDTCVQTWSTHKARWRLLLSVVGALIIIGGLFGGNSGLFTLAMSIGAPAFVAGVMTLMLWRGYSPPRHSSDPSDRQRKVAWGIYALVMAAVFVPRMNSHAMTVPEEERPLLRYVSKLPKDALLAGDPEVMSNIPLVAQRSVFVSSEISYVGEDRVRDFFDAYYAESRQEVYGFCETYGVDYLVVNRNHFSEDYLERESFFFAPYNEYIVDLIERRSDFFLPSIPESEQVFSTEHLFLWRCAQTH